MMEQHLFFVCETDVLASDRFFSLFGRPAQEPEQRLMLAILQDAVECFQNYASARDGTHERHFLDAQEWIFTNDSEWPFSFENICAALGFEPNYLRNGLLKKQQVLRVASPEKPRLSLRGAMNQARGLSTRCAARSLTLASLTLSRKGVARSAGEF